MKFSLQFKHKCEAISSGCRIKLNLRAFERLPAGLLLDYFKAKVVTPHEVKSLEENQRQELLKPDSQWSALTVTSRPLLIVYNPTHAPTRYESSMMHELAHEILEHPFAGFDECTGLPMRNPLHEEEATYLGSCLQIPRRGLAWAIQKNMSLEQIAAYFGASPALVAYRCNLTGQKVRVS